jgi:hypothetical protein
LRFLRRFFDRFSLARRLFNSRSVRTVGPNSLVVDIDDRSYWVHAQIPTQDRHEYQVWTSDIRDITNAPSVVAAPPAAEAVVPDVKRRLEAHFAQSRIAVRYH